MGRADADIILLDNFMDIGARLLQPRTDYADCGSVFFPNFMMADPDETLKAFDLNPYLTPEVSARNWLEVIRYLKGGNPKAEIYFICWSQSTSRDEPERFKRIVEFHRYFERSAGSLGVHVIAPLDVPGNLTAGPEDWHHLHDSVYDAIAGHVYLDVLSRLQSPFETAA